LNCKCKLYEKSTNRLHKFESLKTYGKREINILIYLRKLGIEKGPSAQEKDSGVVNTTPNSTIYSEYISSIKKRTMEKLIILLQIVLFIPNIYPPLRKGLWSS
jgi:hypothetical protein